MGTVKYETKIIGLGELVQDFIDSGILVFFGADAPEEVAEFSILHEHTVLHEDVAAGDIITIDDSIFDILAVGEVANKNLANLGHFVLKFNGNTTPEMPGDICVNALPLPKVKPGTLIKISSPT